MNLDDDDPRPNSPEDVGYTAQSLRRVPPPPVIPTTRRNAMAKKHDEPNEADEQPKEEGPRGFAPFLQQVDDGELHTELSSTLQKHVSELFAYANRFQRDAKGSITLTLNFAVLGNGNVMVAGDVKTKTPKTPRAASMFFRTQGNNLSIENPRQQKLPLRDVGGAAKDKPKDIAAEGAPPRAL